MPCFAGDGRDYFCLGIDCEFQVGRVTLHPFFSIFGFKVCVPATKLAIKTCGAVYVACFMRAQIGRRRNQHTHNTQRWLLCITTCLAAQGLKQGLLPQTSKPSCSPLPRPSQMYPLPLYFYVGRRRSSGGVHCKTGS